MGGSIRLTNFLTFLTTFFKSNLGELRWHGKRGLHRNDENGGL